MKLMLNISRARLCYLVIFILNFLAVQSLFASNLPQWNKGRYVATLFWQTTDGLEMAQFDRRYDSSAAQLHSQSLVPLGSVWKLFIYSYLVENQIPEQDYTCRQSKPASGDEYCCLPGNSIDRDQALAQSCGAYFSVQRWGITPSKWQAWLNRDVKNAPAWMHSIARIQPASLVSVASLLQLMQDLPVNTQIKARNALLVSSLNPALSPVVGHLGTGIRFKTWSWTDTINHGSQDLIQTKKSTRTSKTIENRIGGAVGWLPNGQAFWMGAAGTSKTALLQYAEWMAKTFNLDQVSQEAVAWQDHQACVKVKFFNAYPIEKVKVAHVTYNQGNAGGGADQVQKLAPQGRLSRQQYNVQFKNGQSISFIGSPEQRLIYTSSNFKDPVIEGRFLLEDYVARVVEREGQIQHSVASQALAVLARTWLLQNSQLKEGCYITIDDSKAQRVLASMPTARAQQIALFTQDLIVSDARVQYHQNQAKPAVFSWTAAVDLSKNNPDWVFTDLIFQTYSKAGLTGWYLEKDCSKLGHAEEWLNANAKRWRSQLHTVQGFIPPPSIEVCQVQNGWANSDQRRLRIYLQGWGKLEHRISLIHEYLHLALRNHPNGQNEVLIEKLARQLAGIEAGH